MMTRINKFRSMALFLACLLLMSCGTVDPQPTQKPVEKELVEKPVGFSFEMLPEYDEISTENLLIKKLVINLPANSATETVKCQISLAEKELWSKTVKVNPTEKNQKIAIEVDPYPLPENIDLPVQYTITGITNKNFKNQFNIDMKSNAQLKVSKFLSELKKNAKLKYVYSNEYIISTIDENDQLNFYIYDAVISEAHKDVSFTLVSSFDCKGYAFINNLSSQINYRPAKNMFYIESYFFEKDGRYYKAYQDHPFNGYLDFYTMESQVSGPKISYDEKQMPVREQVATGTPLSILKQHSENDKEIVFRTENGDKINIIFDKAKKVFTSEDYSE